MGFSWWGRRAGAPRVRITEGTKEPAVKAVFIKVDPNGTEKLVGIETEIWSWGRE